MGSNPTPSENYMLKIQKYLKEIRLRILYFFLSFFITFCIFYFFLEDTFYIFTWLFPSFIIIQSQLQSHQVDYITDAAKPLRYSILQSLYFIFFQDKDFHLTKYHCDRVNVLDKSYEGSKNTFLEYTQHIQNSNELPKSMEFIFTNVTEAFHTSLYIGIFFAFYFTIPLFLYQIWSFFVPSFYSQERIFLTYFLVFNFSLQSCGFWTIIFFIYPLFWNFFVDFEIITQFIKIQSEIRVSSYVYFISKICLFTHLVFQLPIVFFFIVKYKIIQLHTLLSVRRILYFIIFLCVAFISPPDFIIQFVISFVFIVQFELCIFFWFVYLQYFQYNAKIIV